jgi:ABC-2 type transport system ATP-binding protein
VPQSAIEVDDVTKRFRLYHEKNSTLKATIMRGRRAIYEEFLALEGVSFDVPEGTTFALIGENGSGKSTMLKCMARILRPDRGTINMRGRVSALLELGAGFHLELSGRENIYLNGSILGLSKKDIDRRFDDIIEFAGGDVPRFIDNPVKNFSSGMFVRLGFAIAINVEPDILLVDEILAVGDEDFQRKCMAKFAELRKSGRTVVVVSHALETVRNLADNAAWFEHGHVRELGPVSKVVDAYLDEVAEQREERRTAPKTVRIEGGHRLREIQLLDAEQQPTTTLRTGEPATVRVGVECGTTGEAEILRIEFYGTDGTCFSRVSTRETDVTVDQLGGYRTIDYEIPQVLLSPQEYDLSVALMRGDGRSYWERADEVLRFEVVPGRLRHRGGLVLMGGDWRVLPAFTSDEV